jgi:hypothetical protein
MDYLVSSNQMRTNALIAEIVVATRLKVPHDVSAFCSLLSVRLHGRFRFIKITSNLPVVATGPAAVDRGLQRSSTRSKSVPRSTPGLRP